MTMFLERLEDLSVYYAVKEIFKSAPNVKVTDDYPVETLTLPSVSVNAGKLRLENFELGNRKGRRFRKWYIDVYAQNKAQRDEFGYLILNAFDNGVYVYDYNVGFPPASGIPMIEHLDVSQKEMDFIRVLPELTEKLYYRSTITMVASNDTE